MACSHRVALRRASPVTDSALTGGVKGYLMPFLPLAKSAVCSVTAAT